MKVQGGNCKKKVSIRQVCIDKIYCIDSISYQLPLKMEKRNKTTNKPTSLSCYNICNPTHLRTRHSSLLFNAHAQQGSSNRAGCHYIYIYHSGRHNPFQFSSYGILRYPDHTHNTFNHTHSLRYVSWPEEEHPRIPNMLPRRNRNLI